VVIAVPLFASFPSGVLAGKGGLESNQKYNKDSKVEQ
jgi:hypothetical protein